MINNYLIQLKNIKNTVQNNTVYVTGHKRPDVDSYISMIYTSELLKKFDIHAVPILLIDTEEIDEITSSVIKKLNCPILEKITPSKNDYVFLVDHNNPVESVGEGKIVGIIDHHSEENINAIFKIVKKSGSASKIIYEIYESLSFNLNAADKKRILYSLSIDTCALMSSKAQKEDKIFSDELCKELNMSINQVKKETLFETNLNQSIDTILKNGLKNYIINGFKVSASYVETLNKSTFTDSKLKELLHSIDDTEDDLRLLTFYDFLSGKTIVHSSGKLSKYVNIIEYPYVASRSTTIMPQIRNILNSINM